MDKHVHVIPVPDGMGVLDAWAELQMMGRFVEGQVVEKDGTGGSWAVIHCDGSCTEGVIGAPRG